MSVLGSSSFFPDIFERNPRDSGTESVCAEEIDMHVPVVVVVVVVDVFRFLYGNVYLRQIPNKCVCLDVPHHTNNGRQTLPTRTGPATVAA